MLQKRLCQRLTALMLGCAHAVARYNRVASTTNQQAFDTMSPSVSVLFLLRIENFSFSAFNLFTDEIRMLPLVSRPHDYIFLKERAMCSRLFPKVSVWLCTVGAAVPRQLKWQAGKAAVVRPKWPLEYGTIFVTCFHSACFSRICGNIKHWSWMMMKCFPRMMTNKSKFVQFHYEVSLLVAVLLDSFSSGDISAIV